MTPVALSDLMVGDCPILMQSGYSRDAESRADDHAFSQMAALEIDPVHVTAVVRILDNAAGQSGSAFDAKPANSELDSEGAEDTEYLVDYISSHPQIEDRAKRANKLSEQFRGQSKLAGWLIASEAHSHSSD